VASTFTTFTLTDIAGISESLDVGGEFGVAGTG